MSLKLARVTGTLHVDLCAFIVISHSVLLRMRNVSGTISRQNQSTNSTLMSSNVGPKVVHFMRKRGKI
jgi:hypothetical protein